jgi:alpha-beta hydrolase superfamily lysophospholipase
MPALTAPDGTQLIYDAYEAAAPRSAVLVLHGWSDHAGRWRETGEQLRAAGHSAYLLDLRGHGRSAGRAICRASVSCSAISRRSGG